MKNRILLTGASGFIGTNLLEDLIKKGYEVCNVDINAPKIEERKSVWKKVDIRDYDELEKVVLEFKPDYFIHLAARTDLDGKTIDDYSSNVIGVENVMKIIHKLPELKKVIITSSKFVTRNGYKIKNQHDYCPHTKYGESKVETEIRVWGDAPHCDWCIIRPTSIWGPWFGVPYRNFFDMVMRRMYFHIGHIKCHKTYGYIGNAVYQIEQLLFTSTPDKNNKVFYIGDEPAYEINEWADEIAHELGFNIPTMPVWFVKCLAKFGDFLGVFGIHFPMQSFRFGNMTNDGTNDMSNTYEIAPEIPYTRLQGTKATIDWIKKYEGK
ncbi:MAG TPA: NAD(P)-dependent oxidoreductase [Candidatus Cottocaccamicrobium excrementipullorum]|nr:NAD(P)-dependent oxidoreductase [Candidatus Cottocaccamicrobium excrementipullorum]